MNEYRTRLVAGEKRKRAYTRQAVENWYKSIAVPAEVAVALEKVIKLNRAQIRPDLWA